MILKKQMAVQRRSIRYIIRYNTKTLQLFSMTLPALVKIFIFSYLPIFGVILAFKNLNYAQGILRSPWVGFKNFEFFFKSEAAWRVTRNTLGMNAIFIVSGLVVSVLCAIALYRIADCKRTIRIHQSAMFFPYFLSWVVVSFLLNAIIGDSGILPHLIESMGFRKINFMIEPKFWPYILTGVNLWKNIGYSVLIYYTVLLNIDPALYEAAEIDGAPNWVIAKKIQIPHLVPMIILNVLLSIGNIFRADFGMFYFLPGENNTLTLAVTDVIDTYAFRALKQMGNLSMSAAVGMYQSVVGFILILLANWFVKKYDENASLF